MGKSVLLQIQLQAHAQSKMSLCIVSFQAVLLAALLVQYHYINEVEAEKLPRYQNGNWLNSMEKRIEIVQGRMNEIYQQFKGKANKFLAHSRSSMRKAIGTRTYNKGTVNKNYNGGIRTPLSSTPSTYDLFKSWKERRDLLAAYGVSDMIGEDGNEADPEAQVVLEKEEVPKSKRKIMKKHKKKIRAKHEKHELVLPHEQQEHTIPLEKHEHMPYEQRLDSSVEQDKEYAQKVLRRIHKKREKERIYQRKFVKTFQKESNSSESDEVKKRKPVDIIVHIKMNE